MSTLTDRTATALLAAIVRDPDDDTLRLAYADYLQENGDEDRAEFIRVQVELTRIGHWAYPHGGSVSTRGALLTGTQDALLAAHPEWASAPCPGCESDGSGWLSNPISVICPTCGGSGDLLKKQTIVGPNKNWERTEPRPHIFRRGFLASVSATLAEWGAEVRPMQPASGNVRIWQPTPLACAVAWLPGVVQLRVTDREPYADVSMWDENMRTFDWQREGVGYAGRSQLPSALFREVIRLAHKYSSPDDDFAEFPGTPEAAHTALAKVLWRLAREAK